MSEELIKRQDDAVSKYDDSDFNKMVTSQKFLPRLQLMTSQSEKCKSGAFPMNHWAMISSSNYTDTGAEVDVLVCSWRPKALDFSDDDEIRESFDPSEDTFNEIVEKSKDRDSGCMWGPEFLLYIPSQDSFVTYFMSSISARNESAGLKGKMRKAATLKSRLIKTKKFSWQNVVITGCTTPFDIPEGDIISEEIQRFENPPKRNREEKVEVSQTDRER